MTARFSQRDVSKAIRGAAAAGYEPSDVTIMPDGAIRLSKAPSNLARYVAAKAELEKHFGPKKD